MNVTGKQPHLFPEQGGLVHPDQRRLTPERVVQLDLGHHAHRTAPQPGTSVCVAPPPIH